MRNILTIVFRLTVSCLLAGVVMGATFMATNKAKKHNEHVREQKVMLNLLGYSEKKPAPETLSMHELHRYIVSEGDAIFTGYLLPLAGESPGKYAFVTIDLDGNFYSRNDVNLTAREIEEGGASEQAIAVALGDGKTIRYTNQIIVVSNGGQRLGYLLPRKFPGFKTFISVMLALEPDFSIRGLEIMEHEEDPGLGGEIVQDYFKKQFKGKSFETAKNLEVVKTPMPEEYRRVLEAETDGQISEEEVERLKTQYSDGDIYALTGATISSRAVTNGVKRILKKTSYRMAILDRVLAEQQIAVPF